MGQAWCVMESNLEQGGNDDNQGKVDNVVVLMPSPGYQVYLVIMVFMVIQM